MELLAHHSGIIILWTIEKISEALGLRPTQSCVNFEATGFAIDSRRLKTGQVFICIRGEKQDGHQYISQALQAGASGLLMEASYAKRCKQLPQNTTIFLCEDGTKALQDLARYHRKNISATVIAITGSNGKTSSKDFLTQLLGTLIGKEKICSTHENYNNHWGVPLSLLQADPHARYLILEMGMNHMGEILSLSKLAQPHHALITCIGSSHHEFFANTEEIAEAKLEILEGLVAPRFQKSNLFYHAYSENAQLASELAKTRDIRPHFFCIESLSPPNVLASELKLPRLDVARNLDVSLAGMQFTWRNQGVHCPYLFHPHLASNLLACLCLLSELGFAQSQLIEACCELRSQTKRRFEMILKERPKQIEQLLVDDSYNASPDSFLAAIDAMKRLKPQGYLALFLGEMMELGRIAQESHRKVALAAAKNGFTLLGLKEGIFSQQIKETYLEALPGGKIIQAISAEELVRQLGQTEDLSRFTGILVKGSRSTQMELVADYIRQLAY